uniref:SDR family oxidoreductase n=1 Tax=Mycobacterium avium TaxID=1764 RepID=UPI000AEA8E35
GVIALTKSLAREMARHQITVNCVCPGPTDTPLFHAQPEKLKEALVKAIPLRRLARPEEVADLEPLRHVRQHMLGAETPHGVAH